MRRLNARFFVSMGLVSLLASVMLLAMYLGYIPDPHATIRQGRAALAETLAVSHFDVDQPVQRQECRGGAGVHREAQCGPAVGGGRQGGRRDGRGHRRPSAELAGARRRRLHGRPDPGPDSRRRREVGAAGAALRAPGPARRHGLRARATDSDGGLRGAGEPAVLLLLSGTGAAPARSVAGDSGTRTRSAGHVGRGSAGGRSQGLHRAGEPGLLARGWAERRGADRQAGNRVRLDRCARCTAQGRCLSLEHDPARRHAAAQRLRASGGQHG